MTNELRTISWTGTCVRLLDQTALPETAWYLDVADVDTLVEAIERLVVRGAPALGMAGAFGVVIAMRQQRREGWDQEQFTAALNRIRRARPTAVNLAWGVDQVAPLIGEGEAAVCAAAQRMLEEEDRVNHAIGRRGAEWVLGRVAHRPVRVLTHCNAGALATTSWGTALGLVRDLHVRRMLGLVYVDETRPLLQGARLTAWELAREDIPHRVQADGAAASTILSGKVDVAIIGADRIAANGDTANKIGSLGVALACREAHIPFVVAAPESTVDMATSSGDAIPIELRDEAEVLAWREVRTAPLQSRGYNPAFDITPARFVSALVTQSRVLELAQGETPITSRTRVNL